MLVLSERGRTAESNESKLLELACPLARRERGRIVVNIKAVKVLIVFCPCCLGFRCLGIVLALRVAVYLYGLIYFKSKL